MPTPLTLDDLTPAILALVDGCGMPIAHVEAMVRGGTTMAPLLAVEAALRDAGLGACELVWGWRAEATTVELRLRMLDAARRPLLVRTFELSPQARTEPVDA